VYAARAVARLTLPGDLGRRCGVCMVRKSIIPSVLPLAPSGRPTVRVYVHVCLCSFVTNCRRCPNGIAGPNCDGLSLRTLKAVDGFATSAREGGEITIKRAGLAALSGGRRAGRPVVYQRPMFVPAKHQQAHSPGWPVQTLGRPRERWYRMQVF
jgi:hypothetical protein